MSNESEVYFFESTDRYWFWWLHKGRNWNCFGNHVPFDAKGIFSSKEEAIEDYLKSVKDAQT